MRGNTSHVPRELEICCYSVSDAVSAQQSGADRIELCAGRPEGGTTPSFGVLQSAMSTLGIPVFPMVRPRGGDFVYDDREFDAMATDVTTIADLGFPGLVLGILDSAKDIDVTRCRELVGVARSINPDIELTFHRAFDEVRDPITSYRQIGELGFTRVLTSGQQSTAVEGASLLESLIVGHGNRPAVMPGGGVRPNNVKQLLDLGATNVHSSATPDDLHGIDSDTVRALADVVHST